MDATNILRFKQTNGEKKMTENKGFFFFDNIKVDIEPGDTISTAARRAGIYLDEPCGGNGKCGKCQVIIKNATELASSRGKILTEKANSQVYSLACQTEAVNGMVVFHNSQRDGAAQILTYGTEQKSAILPSSSETPTYGIALDIGTTTIVMYLVNIKNGEILGTASAINPQTCFGADVISRISYADANKDGISVLHNILIKKLNEMLQQFYEKGVAKDDLSKILAAGNTTMSHLFAGVSPSSIGRSTFIPEYLRFPPYEAGDLGLDLNKKTPIEIVPNISGFVGGDITAGIVLSRMAHTEKLSLLIDIGTNNEMVLGNKNFMLCCSAAAGPALEGAKITCGMRASAGAIDSVGIYDNNIKITTIAAKEPLGICGSGLVDAVAVLLKSGVVTDSGRFAKTEDIKNSKLARLLNLFKPASFSMTENSSTAVYITQKDIREIQLAKAAILTGIEIMLEESEKNIDEIEQIFLAGAFGNYLNIANASEIGLLPKVKREIISSIGNSSGLGAVKILSNNSLAEEASAVSQSVKHLELASHRLFQDIFVKNISFNTAG